MVVVASLFFQSCEKAEDSIETFNYYPLEVGLYKVYQVNETVYSAGVKDPVKKSWQEKDEITSVSEDGTGAKIYMISRYSRNTADQSWQKVKIYTAQNDVNKILVNIDNEILMPLIFPYGNGLKWDGYTYFQLPEDDVRENTMHEYMDVNKPLTIGSLSFDRTLKVSERDNIDNIIDYNLGYKQYAENVGLIYDEQTDYLYLQEGGTIIGDKIIASGKSTIRQIIEYGKN